MAGWTPDMKRAARLAAKLGTDPIEAAHAAYVPGGIEGADGSGLPSWWKWAALGVVVGIGGLLVWNWKHPRTAVTTARTTAADTAPTTTDNITTEPLN